MRRKNNKENLKKDGKKLVQEIKETGDKIKAIFNLPD
jgi:hypothetical protein